MPIKYVWQPKTERLQREIEKFEPEYIGRWRHLRTPTMGAYEPDPSMRREEQDELYWMSEEERESELVKRLQFEKEAKEWMPWIAAGVAFPGATALKGWQLAGKLPWWLEYPAKTILSPLAGVEKGLSAFGELGKRAVGKLVTKAQETVATYLQKLEAHRMARQAGWSEEYYKKLALGTTGKESMAKMTRAEADKFIEAISAEGGIREIILPAELGIVKQEAKQEAKSIALELSEYLGKVPKEVGKVPRLGRPKRGVVTKAKEGVESFTQRTYRLERILDALDGYPKSNRYNVAGGKMTQTFYNSINRAEDKKLRGVTAVLDDFRGIVAKMGVNTGRLFSREVNIQGIPLNADVRMDIVANTLHPDNLRHLMSPKGNNLSKQFIQDVINSLNAEEKQLLGWVTKRWQKDTPKVAEAFEIATGKKFKAVEGQYVPIILERDYAIPLSDELISESTIRYMRKWSSSLIKQGFTKARSAKANQPMQLGLFQKFTSRLPEVEHYKAYQPIIRDLQRILVEPHFRNSMLAKAGKTKLSVLEQWLRDVAQTNPLAARNWSDATMQTLRVNAVTAVLGWNVTTMLKQFPSYMIGATRIGQFNALKGLYLSIVDRKGTSALIKRLAPQIHYRTMEREIAENRMTKAMGAKIFERQNLRELFMWLTLNMDRTVVLGLWRGSFEDGLKKVGGEKLAAEYASKSIRETQPFFGMKDVAQLWREQGKSGEILRVLTMFQNQLNQYWNYYRHIVYGGWRHRQISTGEALKQFMEGFIIPSLMIGAVTRSDIARTPKDAITDVATMAFSTVPVLGQFVASGLRGFRDTQGLISTELMERGQRAAYEFNKEEWAKVAMVLPEIVGYAAGVPVAQPSRMIRAILDKGSDVFDDWLQLIWGTYAREEVTKEEGEFKRSGGGFERSGSEFKRR